jgi:predicted flap endonuclease-1-like 5' DNA nuclease
VQVLGDFNAWSSSAKEMKSSKGQFTFDVELPAGKSFQYRYLIDGQAWDNDSNADYYVDSPYAGIQNSVVVLDALNVKPSSKAVNEVKKSVSSDSEGTKAKKASSKAKKASSKTKEASSKAKEASSKTKETSSKTKVASTKPAPKPTNATSATKEIKSSKSTTAKTEATLKTVTKSAPKATSTKPKTAVAKPSTKKAGDDLTKIEGIGPKIAQLLNASGIQTFDALAKATKPQLQGVMDKAGSKFAMHDVSTWPEQSKLAASGKWDDLKVLQDKLVAGRKK